MDGRFNTTLAAYNPPEFGRSNPSYMPLKKKHSTKHFHLPHNADEPP